MRPQPLIESRKSTDVTTSDRRFATVLMEYRSIDNPWVSGVWKPLAVLPADSAAAEPPRCVESQAGREVWMHTGFEVVIHRHEADGYYLNLTTEQPFAFVEWEPGEEGGPARPLWVTLSYDEAARRMDGGATVEGVPMPPEWLHWLAAYTEEHFVPFKKKERARPKSFKGARRDEP